MAKDFDISLLGDKELARTLRRLPDKFKKKILTKALRETAKPIQARAKQLVGPGVTQKLKENIKIVVIKRSRKAIGVVIRTGTKEEMGIPKDDSYYPAHVELGTRKTSPSAFFRKAMAELGPREVENLKRRIRRGIETVNLKTGKGISVRID